MEKRILGITLALLGVVGLVIAAIVFINGGGSERHIKTILVYGILGAIFFFSGIGLVRRTNDKAT
jgi:hypothetical protein